MTNKIQTYQKKLDYSYSVGVYTTLELVRSKPEIVKIVFFDPKGKKNRGLEEIISICSKRNILCEQNQKLVEKLSRTGNSFVIGVFDKFEGKLKNETNHVVLVNPQDQGNLGTICRTMLGFNFRDLAMIKPCTDIFDPKTIKASMGSIFKVNCELFDSFADYKRKNSRKLFCFMTDGHESLEKVYFDTKPYSLVFGSESSGLGDEFKTIDQSVRIPQNRDIDSLNLSIAAGIVMYQTTISNI